MMSHISSQLCSLVLKETMNNNKLLQKRRMKSNKQEKKRKGKGKGKDCEKKKRGGKGRKKEHGMIKELLGQMEGSTKHLSSLTGN